MYKRQELTPSETILKASISKPESVSSNIASFGLRIDIWRISFFFFSPPEKPTFSCLLNFSSSNFNSFDFSLTTLRNSIASNSFSPLAFLIAFKDVLRKIFVFTPGISSGYWNAKNIPLWALSSVSKDNKSSPSNVTVPLTS